MVHSYSDLATIPYIELNGRFTEQCNRSLCIHLTLLQWSLTHIKNAIVEADRYLGLIIRDSDTKILLIDHTSLILCITRYWAIG